MQQILIKALESPDADQRYAALSRLKGYALSAETRAKIVTMLSNEKDGDLLSALIQLVKQHRIKEAIPTLVKMLDHPTLWHTATDTLSEIGGHTAISALQSAFKKNPSKIIAIALLNLGDPHPYFENFAENDLKLFSDEDARMIYTDPYWMIMLGIPTNWDKTYNTKMIPTVASHLKPEAKKNIEQMLDLFAQKRDGAVVPFLFALLDHPKNPISEERISSTMSVCLNQENIPFLHAKLKDEKHARTRLEALHILASMGDKSITPYLIEAIQENFDCPMEVESLARLAAYPGEYEALFKSILEDKRYSEDTRVTAAYILACQGKRDGIQTLFKKLYKETTSLAPNPDKIQELAKSTSNILRPEDIPQIVKLLDANHPAAITLGLEFLKQVGGPEHIPLILPKLADNNLNIQGLNIQLKLLDGQGMDSMAARETKLEIRFRALIALATLRRIDDAETLETIKSEITFWKAYLKGQETQLCALVRKFMPNLEEYVRRFE